MFKEQQLKPADIFGIVAVDPKQEVGLEIECEGRNLISGGILSYWGMHQDPSLRGAESMEYTLKAPVRRDKVRTVVEYLQKKFKEHGTVLKPSNRTSLHTHINVQDLTMKHIVQFVVAYMLVENLLVDHCGPWRKGNLFCLRSSEAEFLVRLLESSVRNENYALLATDEIRYSSCNLAALGKFGSLEFRSHTSTVDADVIDRWVTMLLEVKDWSQTFKDPTEIIKAFSELGPQGVLKAMGPVIYKTVGGTKDLEYQMTEGMHLAQAVAFATKWLPTPERDVKAENLTITVNTGGEAPRPFARDWAQAVAQFGQPQPLHPDLEQPLRPEGDPDEFPHRVNYPNWAMYSLAIEAWEERKRREGDVLGRQPGPVARAVIAPVPPLRPAPIPPLLRRRNLPIGTRQWGTEAAPGLRSIWEWTGQEWRLV